VLDRHVIANMALDTLGAAPISSFNQGTTEANSVSRHYEQVVRECIGDHPWSFAKATATLGQDATPAALDFDYSYTRPTDCISPRWLLERCGTRYVRSKYPYRVQDSKICTDLSGAGLAYIRRPPENSWDPKFVAAVMLLLASRMAMPLTEVNGKADELFKLHMVALAVARSRDSQKDTPDVFDTSELLAWHAG
jgi:hypothetical protein